MPRVLRHLSALLAALALLQPLLVAALVDCASRATKATTAAAAAHAAHSGHAIPSSSTCESARDECDGDRPGESCDSMAACQSAAVAIAPTIAAATSPRAVERATLVFTRYAGPELPPDDPPPRV